MGNTLLGTVRNEQNKDVRAKELLRAVRQFATALKQDPRNAYAAMGIGICFAEEEKYTEARDVFESVREMAPDVPWVLMNLGHVYIELKQYEMAVSLFETFGKRHPKLRDAYFYQSIARAYFVQAESEKKAELMVVALRNIQKAVRLNPSDKLLLYNLAVVMQHNARIVVQTSRDNRTRAQLQQARAWTSLARTRFSWLGKFVEGAKAAIAAQKGSSASSLSSALGYLPYKELGPNKHDCDKLIEALEREVQSQERHEREREKRFRLAAEAKEAERKRQEEAEEAKKKKEEALRLARLEEAARKQEKLRDDMRAREEKERLERERRKELSSSKESKKRKKQDDGFLADEDEEEAGSEAEIKAEIKREPKELKRKRAKGSKKSKGGQLSEELIKDEDEDSGVEEKKSRRRLKRK
ncbi:protein required for normal CLN1 and CLN2 G1 cyclin expression, partial [Gonapodya sp. JEL0774]